MSTGGMPVLDCGMGGIPSGAAVAFGSIAMNGDEYVRCNRCGYGGCDVKVAGCGCTLHARCFPLPASTGALTECPQCHRPTSGLVLFPMSFREIDEARKTAVALASSRRGRKRKSLEAPCDTSSLDEKASYVSERRTGRWTTEEMTYCDQLIAKFEHGQLPLADGVKLNEFLGNMLKSKQSRLTKKMKNAKLSSRTFVRTAGYILDQNEVREFSELEESFFQAIQCHQERAEIKFHMQKEWREHFSQLCVAIGQPLDADAWLSSVEEMDRRLSQARDAARMARRKVMMSFALRADTRNREEGVFIEKTIEEQQDADAVPDALMNGADEAKVTEEMLTLIAEKSLVDSNHQNFSSLDMNGKSTLLHSAPFLSKVVSYIQRHAVPFEHVDVWVPSFVPANDAPENGPNGAPVCRLCYAGSATVEKIAGTDGKTNSALTAEDQFNLFAFGDYSQKFSFDVGCGLPGRVYHSGLPTWEQNVQNAPRHHFERCGGAIQWGIKTVLGIPIASPNVGRIVVTLYSVHDRQKDQDLVARLSEEFNRLLPSPKWKLVVDIGEVEAAASIAPGTAIASTSTAANNTTGSATASIAASDDGRDNRIDDVISLLGEYMPSDPASNLSLYLSGFMSLRLLLLRPTRTPEEDEMVGTMLSSFSSFTAGGRSRVDIAVMLARDFMFLNQQSQQMPFLGIGQAMMGSRPAPQSGFSLFGLSSIDVSSIENSPALAPISSAPDCLSIVSN